MADPIKYAFQAFLEKYPDVLATGRRLTEQMTVQEIAEFKKRELALFYWGENHFAFSYSKDYAVGEWLEWYKLPDGLRLLLYAKAAEQYGNGAKSSIGADVLPRWVWEPVGSGKDSGWLTMIRPLQELRDQIYIRLKWNLPTPPAVVVTPPTEQNTTTPPHTLDSLQTGGSSFTDQPTPTAPAASPMSDNSIGGQVAIGVIVALIVGYIASRS